MSEHTDALNAMDGIPASVGFCEPVEGYRYRPNDAVRSITEMACEITHIRQQLNQKQADLDRALARVADAIGSLETVSGKAELGASVARAERTETMNYVAEGFGVIKEYAQSEAARLRQQADQMEADMGEDHG